MLIISSFIGVKMCLSQGMEISYTFDGKFLNANLFSMHIGMPFSRKFSVGLGDFTLKCKTKRITYSEKQFIDLSKVVNNCSHEHKHSRVWCKQMFIRTLVKYMENYLS